jgi:hypothetical protein
MRTTEPEREPDVLADDTARDVGETDELRETTEVRAQQGHIGAPERDLVELGTDGHTHVGASEGRRVVHAITNHHDGTPGGRGTARRARPTPARRPRRHPIPH